MLARHRALHYFSPSQVDQYLGCKRKWAFKYIARIDTSQHASAQVGDRMHAQLEKYLDGGAFDFTEVVNGVRVAEVASSGLQYLPQPKTPGVEIEKKFEFTSPRTGFVWTGRKDFSGPDSSVLPGFLVEGEKSAPFTGDHKSCGSINWAKTPRDLHWDPQGIIYSKEAMDRTGAPLVDLAWVYYQTRDGKASKRVRLRMHEHHVHRAFNIIEDVALEMAAFKDAATPPLEIDNAPKDEGPPDLRREWSEILRERAAWVNKNVPPTPTHCKAFGQCGYWHVCELTLAESQKRSMSNGQQKTEFLNDLEKRAAAQDGKAPETASTSSALPSWMSGATTPAPEPTPTPPSTPEAPPTPEPPPSNPLFGDPTKLPAPDGLPSWMTNGAGPAVNPPESALPPPQLPPEPVATSTPPVEEKPKTGKGSRGPRKPKDPPKDPLGADALAATTPEPEWKAKLERGETLCGEEAKQAQDALRAEVEKARAAAPVVNNVTVISTEQTKPVAQAEDKAPPTAGNFTLYVDCFPLGTNAEMVEKYIARAQDDIRTTTAEAGSPVADYRMLPYGQGGGVLAGCVARELEKDPCAHLVIRTNTREANDILATLMSRAARIVQGTR